MNIKIINYTGVSFKLKWDSTHDFITCNTEKVIQIEQSNARLTRFFAKYRSIPESPIIVRGQINVVFDSSKDEHILVLGAFTAGEPKYIGCITINDVGRYLYSEYSRNVLQQRYPTAKFYNIPVDFHFDNTLMTRLKKLYYITFNQAHCENRDGPMCDKIIGIPVLIILILILIIICIAIVVAVGMGYVNLHLLKK